MAVPINALKYIPDLPAASSANGVDLLHLSQGGNDKQLTITALLKYMADKHRPVGSLFFSGVKGKDPNTLFSGQTWVRHGAGRSLRVCADDESNMGGLVGADTVTLALANLPAHAHAVGTLSAASAGAHAHNGSTSAVGDHTHAAWTGAAGSHNHQGGMGAPGAQWSTIGTGTDNTGQYKLGLTSVVGNHTHTVGMNGAGAHNHTFTTNTTGAHTHAITGSTGSVGSATPVNIVPASIYVGCWIRTV